MDKPNLLVIPVLKLSDSAPLLCLQASEIVEAVAANPQWFPDPEPPLDEIRVAIRRLSDAQALTLTRVRGSVPRRDHAQRRVISLLNRLRAYVERAAFLNADEAEEMVQKVKMFVKQSGGRKANALGAKEGDRSGVVVLTTKRIGDRAWYEWQMSTDGKTWKSLGVSTRTKRVVRDLTPGKTYFFRVRSGKGDEVGDWSQVISYTAR